MLGLLGLMVLAGLFSVLTGQDCNFDLMNYHFYNAHAFLFRQGAQDVMPAGIYSYFNPLLDVPYYLFVLLWQNFPRWVAFLHGSIYGIYAFFIYRICGLFFPGKDGWEKYARWFAFIIGVTGTAGISQIGMSSGEIYEAVLLSCAVWLALNATVKARPQGWLAGAVAAAAVAFGFKYTAAPFVLALGCVVLYVWRVRRLSAKWLAVYAALAAGIVFVLDGWLWADLWKRFSNPLFPFYNAWFGSAFFDPVNLIDRRFFPQDSWQLWIYPFYWFKETFEMGTEAPFADPRWPLAYVSFMVLAVIFLVRRKQMDGEQRHKMAGLLIFSGVGYSVWLLLFLILRYAVVLEGLLGILLMRVLSYTGRKLRVVLACILCPLIALTSIYPDWGKEPFAEKVVAFDALPSLPDNSLVLVQTQALSYVLPFLNPTARFVGGLKVYPQDYPAKVQSLARRRNQLMPVFYAYHFDQPVQQAIDGHKGPVYLLTYYWPYALYPAAWQRWGLRGDIKDCIAFNSNWNKYFEYMILCPLEKMEKE